MVPQCEFDLAYGKIEMQRQGADEHGSDVGSGRVHVQPDDERVRDVREEPRPAAATGAFMMIAVTRLSERG